MTMRVIRWLQQGSLTAIVPLVLLGVVALVLLAPATERPATMQDTVRSGKVHRTSPDSYPAAAGQTLYIPTGAHSTGALGTNWRTDVAVHNPGSTQASYTFALLRRDADNSSPATASFSLAPGTCARYTDIIDSVFHFYGAAALRVTVTSGSVLFTSNTYNRLSSDNPNGFPDGSTFGQFVPAFLDSTAVTVADEGRLIHLSHTDAAAKTAYRTNIGVLNATSATLDLTIDLYTATGALLGTLSRSLQPYEFKQYDALFAPYLSAPLADGYAIVRTSTSAGRFFAYACVIDNRTGDPIYIPAQTCPRTSTTPTPTPTTGRDADRDAHPAALRERRPPPVHPKQLARLRRLPLPGQLGPARPAFPLDILHTNVFFTSPTTAPPPSPARSSLPSPSTGSTRALDVAQQQRPPGGY